MLTTNPEWMNIDRGDKESWRKKYAPSFLEIQPQDTHSKPESGYQKADNKRQSPEVKCENN